MTTQSNEYKCFNCGETFNPIQVDRRFKDPGGNPVCASCFHDNYCTCQNCLKIINQCDSCSADGGDTIICQNCCDNDYFYCNRCETYLRNRYCGTDGLCQNCYNEINDNSDNSDSSSINRKYHQANDYVEAFKRAYSCEIETYYPDYDEIEAVAEILPKAIGISDDGSLSDNGKEFQTPKLSGDKGDKLLKNLCETLVKHNFSVDKSCGLHIHLDGSDYEGNSSLIKKLWLFYLIFEPVLYSYLPYSRRTNRYCMPLAQFYQETEISLAQDTEKLEKIWYREQRADSISKRKAEKYDRSRYAGVNLHSLFSNGHLEIRHHSGTIDYKKIKNWIELHLAIMDGIAKGNFSTEQLLKAKYALNLEAKQEIMFSLLALTDETKAYFLARLKKFGSIVKEETICVE